MPQIDTGLIRQDEAYSKQMVLQRLGISQKFWDKLLDEGLPYTNIGHSRWVTGRALIEHLVRNAERKRECIQHQN
ncbi:topoisomerase II [Rhodopirellula sp. MGV]|uniref:topoisomerase II n=1 Tax=Rhodopirellula sp. MGV TaxID=2023130 RepID=UPI000B96EF13|nr:topoisomerase II [Rhodopirellula sp. MGV]OYP28524.1 topoisomerase II [Rhodopirellula sp. MGV]PNY38901.1 topoisomerase II [Rhodopirellula baltica]